MSDYTGQTIRSYIIQEEVGRGGHGVVYKAIRENTGETVAAKVLLPEYIVDEKMVKRLEIEAQIVRDLQHPNIVHCDDSWRDDSGVWLIMRWMGGGNLRQYIKTHHPLSLRRMADMVDQVSAALEVAHEAGIVHRDLKPDNIVLDEAGNACLTDFGIARRLGYNAITSMGVVMGSPGYLTPEQILGEPVSAQTDIYAFGVMLYEMIAGVHPYSHIRGHVQLMIMLAQQELPLVHEARPDVPEAVSEVIRKATVRQPGQRYGTVLAFAEAFREAAGLSV